MNEQFPLFDTLQIEAKEAELKAQQESRDHMRELVKCHFCKETMQRFMMTNNHGVVFNGWCMKALGYHVRNGHRLHSVEAEWLQSKGINPELSRFDESQWHLANIENHYKGHDGRCYYNCGDAR
jgi:hypothetical protein